MRSFRHKLLVLAVPTVLAAAAAGQQSILFSMDHSGHTTNGGAGIALLHVNDQDINLVTPSAGGPYFARKFYNVAAWRCMLGDSNGAPGALSYANGAPVSEVDSIQLAPDANLSDGVQLSDLWVSFNDNVPVLAASGVPLVEEGDLVQFLPGGAIVKRVTRAQINTLINQPVATPCDVDGFGISAAGDAFWSESQNVGPVQDGCIWTAPAGTWNTTGFAQTSGAFLILIEPEVSALIANATGGAFTSVGDLKGVEIDPNGGIWTATRRKVIGGVITTIDTAQVPNLIFSASQVGATLFTTANGGSVAVVNGISMGGPPWNNTTLGPAMGIAASPATPTIWRLRAHPGTDEAAPLRLHLHDHLGRRSAGQQSDSRNPLARPRGHRAVRIREPRGVDGARLGNRAGGPAFPFRSDLGVRLQRSVLSRSARPPRAADVPQPVVQLRNGPVRVRERGHRDSARALRFCGSSAADRRRRPAPRGACAALLPVTNRACRRGGAGP